MPTLTFTLDYPLNVSVQPGDTLSGIAQKFEIPNWRDIADANGISDPASLQAGATIVIPSSPLT